MSLLRSKQRIKVGRRNAYRVANFISPLTERILRSLDDTYLLIYYFIARNLPITILRRNNQLRTSRWNNFFIVPYLLYKQYSLCYKWTWSCFYHFTHIKKIISDLECSRESDITLPANVLLWVDYTSRRSDHALWASFK